MFNNPRFRLLVGIVLCFPQVIGNAGTQAWEEDLAYYSVQLRSRHINLFHTMDQSAFESALERIRQISGEYADEKRLVSLMRLTSRIGDGHTSIPLWGSSINRFPIEFTFIEEDLVATGVSSEFVPLLGATLVKVNGTPIDDIVSSFSEIVPFNENKQSERVRVAMYLPIENLLTGLGFATRENPALFEFQIGNRTATASLLALNSSDYDKEELVRLSSFHPTKYFKMEHQISEELWLGTTDTKDIVYIEMSSYARPDEIDGFGKHLLKYLNTNKSKFLIVDLRRNYGGDFYKGLQIASYLNLADSVRWQDGVFILVGPKTFSAAMANAVQFRQILNGTLVGEAPGARPCGYQDMGQFNLPNTKLLITYSKRYFCFGEADTELIPIDLEVTASLVDFA